MTKIKFGTSGWRAILADEFTFENVRIVTQAICDLLREKGETGKGVVVGYDTRFMGRRFALEAAEILAANGIKAFLCKRDVPTPVIAFEILRRKAAGGINFTASHNPPEYNGLKFSSSWGGPALPETTGEIERRANEMMGEMTYREVSLKKGMDEKLIEIIDPIEPYLEDLKKKVDLSVLKGMNVGVDHLYGTSRGYLDTLLEDAGCDIIRFHEHPDPVFGGRPPEPAEENIRDLIEKVKGDSTISLGLATDGDADRFGIVDKGGRYIEPNYIIALLLDYLIRTRGWKGGVARSVATTHLIDRVAKKHGVEVYETPVGFKYIGELISEDKLVIGGEESAGLTIKGHVPEKDGILACLLVAEMVAREGKSVTEMLDNLYSEVGTVLTRRVNIHLQGSGLKDRLKTLPSSFAGLNVDKVVTIDGTKLVLSDGSWVLIRPSGTEPVVRFYAEAFSQEGLDRLTESGKALISGQ
ncbi:MAG: phosphoglucomutase/phosphomannomutase family protein [Deltaproteobacteria bacterium]|nr:phosphoglucomutase/phosphomannomutase family protein [Deltaproteobacteria bacterium]